MARTERRQLIRDIETHRQSRVICCLTSDRPNAAGVIAKDFIPIFFNHLNGIPDAERQKIDVFMLTTGGDTLAAFGLARLIREFAGDVGLLAPEKCQSAGTLFALGANEIVMGKAATLTPIDPSVNSPLGPVVQIGVGQPQLVPVSVESVAGYRSLLKEEWGLTGQGLALAFKLLAEKINPLVLGDVYRSRQQIERLATELLSHRKESNNIQSIVRKLTRALGSHDYLISKAEARQILGKQVAADDLELEALMWRLYSDFASEMKLGQVWDVGMAVHDVTTRGQALPATVEQQVVLVESTIGGDKFERVMLLSRSQVMTPAGPIQAPQAAVVRAGWTRYD